MSGILSGHSTPIRPHRELEYEGRSLGESSLFLRSFRYGLLHRPRSRRSRLHCLALFLSLILVLLFWSPIGNIGLSNQALTGYHVPSDLHLPWHDELSGSSPTLFDSVTGPGGSFHLLIPASETNSNLCKSIYSAFVLGYPPPALINFGDTYDEPGKFRQKEASHTAKIRGIFNYLNEKKGNRLEDNDQVLVVDGFDVFFQLPAELLLNRFRILLEQHNERWRRRYGTSNSDKVTKEKTTKHSAKFVDKVIFGADKICFPNLPFDPACAAVPSSTLPQDVYGDDTDEDLNAFHNRPKYLNSGTIMGSIADVRAVFGRAVHKVDFDHRGTYGDQFVFAEIIGEQEYEREFSRRSESSGWLHWLSNGLGTSETPNFTSITKERIPTPGRSYEFGIGLDYESSLFQTMTHSWDDINWLSFNNTDALRNIQKTYGVAPFPPTSLPSDIHHLASGPFPSNVFNATLDTLGQNLTWLDIPLATNVYSRAVPAILHFNGIGAKIHMHASWRQMWYQRHARVLLHAATESSHAEGIIDHGSSGSDESSGGRTAGAWTGNRTWMSWIDLCQSFEVEVFGDEMGAWVDDDTAVKDHDGLGGPMNEDEKGSKTENRT